MGVIAAPIHRILDIVTVLAFALAPTVLGLTGLPAMLAYVLAGVHLVMTLLTTFSPEQPSAVPLVIHGAVECVVGLTLIALPWLLGWEGMARTFYLAAGAVILVVWILSRYRDAAAGSPPAGE